MIEMLGEDNEWGVVVENSEKTLYQGIKNLLGEAEMLAHYKGKAAERGKMFSTQNTVRAAEKMLLEYAGGQEFQAPERCDFGPKSLLAYRNW